MVVVEGLVAAGLNLVGLDLGKMVWFLRGV